MISKAVLRFEWANPMSSSVLKIIGKVINGSGLNQVFEEVGKQTITYEACYHV